MTTKAIKIFFSYAHEDEPLRENLKKQLRILQRQGFIEMWHDRLISPGTNWENEIEASLNTAQVILLLISPDFMDSDYCYSVEMKHAMERHERGEALVIPIILRHVYWQGALFGQLQPLPLNAIPVVDASWNSLDVAFFNVAEGIRKAIEHFSTKNKQGPTLKTQELQNTTASDIQFLEKPYESNRGGQDLGNYHLTRLLGIGGFSEVYLGSHRYLGTPAAVKVLRTYVVDDEADTFRRAALPVTQLVHPHIVRVFDYGVEENVPYLVMDYAPNGTLRQHHPRGTRLPLPTIVSYVKQIAEALQYAHDIGRLHRDIKPENILLGSQNELLLSDFSLMPPRSSGPLGRMSQSPLESIAGTVYYMAPEQIMGRAGRASDQYALGVVAYEWICGLCPFTGSLPEITTQHLLAPPPTLRDKVAIPLKVESVIMKALAKDPEDRFFTVEAFANALYKTSQN